MRLRKGTKVQKGVHCLIAETQVPDNQSSREPRARSEGGICWRLRGPARQVLEVKQGWQVLQAVPTNYATTAEVRLAQRRLLPCSKDNVALRGNQISNPAASHRPERCAGCHVRLPGQRRQPVPERHAQHRVRAACSTAPTSTSRIALDNQLVSVPNVAVQGIRGTESRRRTGGSEITGGFTTTTA